MHPKAQKEETLLTAVQMTMDLIRIFKINFKACIASKIEQLGSKINSFQWNYCNQGSFTQVISCQVQLSILFPLHERT